MFRLVEFFRKAWVPLLFVVLESLAIHYYSHSTGYTEARLLSASNAVVGAVHGWVASVKDYFLLARTNRMLVSRIVELENTRPLSDSLWAGGKAQAVLPAPYRYLAARVTYNSTARQENYFVVNAGTRRGVVSDMAVLGAEGTVAGYVLKASEKFSVCMSVLSRDFKTGGRIKGKDYFGSVGWDGRDPSCVLLTEIPKYAPIEVGDTVVSAFSSRFPPDALIGTVKNFRVADNNTTYDITVRLFTDMAVLRDVLLVGYADRDELIELTAPFTPID